MPTSQSNAEAILYRIGAQQGWDQASMLALALEYINQQHDNAAWKEYLRVAAELESE